MFPAKHMISAGCKAEEKGERLFAASGQSYWQKALTGRLRPVPVRIRTQMALRLSRLSRSMRDRLRCGRLQHASQRRSYLCWLRAPSQRPW